MRPLRPLSSSPGKGSVGKGVAAIVLFRNVQAAVRAEHVVQAEGIESKLIPIPRHLSAECGMALRIPAAEAERVQVLLERARVEHTGIHEL